MSEKTLEITLEMLHEELKQVTSLLSSQKTVLTMNDCAAYTGFQKDYLYKLTHAKSIPFYKPTGRKLFFKKSEIDAWLLTEKGQ